MMLFQLKGLIEGKERVRRVDAERRAKEKEEKPRREHENRVKELSAEVTRLREKAVRYGLDLRKEDSLIQAASTLFQQGQLQGAEDRYNDVKDNLQGAIQGYEAEQEVERQDRMRARRKQRNKRIAIAGVIFVLLISSGVGGYVWYSWDLDGDGVLDRDDVFPDDSDKQVDSDGDSVIDLDDAFPNDPAASIDTDKDGFPDEWNEGFGENESTTGLHLDAFPTDENEWIDTDKDGVGDNSDAFPQNSTEWIDSDGDGVGDNSEGATWIRRCLMIRQQQPSSL